jgi:hypothetical protein
MLCEEGAVHALGGGLLRHGLRAVLAVFAQLAAMVRVGPSTARAIEAILLVQLVQDLQSVQHAGFLTDVCQRSQNGRNARRAVLAVAQGQAGMRVRRKKGDVAWRGNVPNARR